MALTGAYNFMGKPTATLKLLDHFESRVTRDYKLQLQLFRAETLCRVGSYEQGFRHFRQAIERASREKQHAVWSQLYAEYLCRQGRYGEALKAIAPSAKTETRPSVLQGHAMTMAWALAGSGEIAAAERLYRDTRPQINSDMSPLMRAIVEPVEALLKAKS